MTQEINSIYGELNGKAVACEYLLPEGVAVPMALIEGTRINLTRVEQTTSIVRLCQCINASYTASETDLQYWSERIDAWLIVVCAEQAAYELMQYAAPSVITQSVQ
jgi:hypothetical protein